MTDHRWLNYYMVSCHWSIVMHAALCTRAYAVYVVYTMNNIHVNDHMAVNKFKA